MTDDSLREIEILALEKEPACFACVWIEGRSLETFHRTFDAAKGYSRVVEGHAGVANSVRVEEARLADAYKEGRLTARQIRQALWMLQEELIDAADCPLTPPERARAARFERYFIVWYEDLFDRDAEAWPMAFFADQAAADRFAEEKNKGKQTPGNFERHEVTGPHNLREESADRSRGRAARAALHELESATL